MRAAAFAAGSFFAPFSWEAPDDMLWRAEHLRESRSFFSQTRKWMLGSADKRGNSPTCATNRTRAPYECLTRSGCAI
jgi:hypothetical protein